MTETGSWVLFLASAGCLPDWECELPADPRARARGVRDELHDCHFADEVNFVSKADEPTTWRNAVANALVAIRNGREVAFPAGPGQHCMSRYSVEFCPEWQTDTEW